MRYQILALFFLMAGIAYVQRAAISVPAEQVAKDLAISNFGNSMGFVQSAWYLGYALLQIPAGPAGRWRVLADLRSTTGGKVDLLVGRDSNGDGVPSEAELACVSAMNQGVERCELELDATALDVRLAALSGLLDDPRAAGRPLEWQAEVLGQGELVLRAPWLTQGYFREPEKGEELWAHGWLHTGDVATIDGMGFIEIRDRIKDVIKTGGEWISSLALEDLVSRHPAVREVAVVGIADPQWGERPFALLVVRDGTLEDRIVRDLPESSARIASCCCKG